MSKDFTPEPKDVVRLKQPAADYDKITGHGLIPEALVINVDGKRYELKFGQDFMVSSHCDPDGKVASLDSGGSLPLIRTEFVEQHINQFTLIKKYKEE